MFEYFEFPRQFLKYIEVYGAEKVKEVFLQFTPMFGLCHFKRASNDEFNVEF